MIINIFFKFSTFMKLKKNLFIKIKFKGNILLEGLKF